MNCQQIFDTVVSHLHRQGCKARISRFDTCRYRVGDLKCAIGCLIPDELYDPAIEGSLVHSLDIVDNHWSGSRRFAEILASILNESEVEASHRSQDLLQKLQGVHDGLEVFMWEYRLREIAFKFNLTFPELP